jgi:aminomethyltransferase
MYAPSFASLGALHLPVVSGLRRSRGCDFAPGLTRLDLLRVDYRDVIVAGEYESVGGRLVRVRDLSFPIPSDRLASPRLTTTRIRATQGPPRASGPLGLVMSEQALARTPLYEAHKALGGEFVPFAGWDMPVQYRRPVPAVGNKDGGLVAEHLACRATAGLFDVSHMGEILIEGPDAVGVANRIVTNDVGKLAVGEACYSALCREDGTTVDDIYCYRIGEQVMLIVVNASNVAKDFAHMQRVAEGNARLTNASHDFAQIALQGPAAYAILEAVLPGPTLRQPRNRIARHEGTGALAGLVPWVATTGYTGEPGYELYCTPEAAPRLWAALIEAGAPHGIAPVGLAARDTLRLEAGYCLYGHELDDTTNPLEAGIAWAVKLTADKGPFVGRAALEAIKAAGLSRRRVGIELEDRGIPRQGYPIYTVAEGGEPVGHVTSGTQSPSLKRPVGLAYVAKDVAAPGTPVWVEIHGKRRRARVEKPVFYTTAAV